MARKYIIEVDGRPIGLEYYRQLVHRNPAKKTAASSELNARIAAAKHLDKGDYIKVVAFSRVSGRVLWTRMLIGKHLILQRGDQANEKVVLEVPEVES